MIPVFFWILLFLYVAFFIAGLLSPQAATYRAKLDTVFIIALFLLLGLTNYQNPLK